MDVTNIYLQIWVAVVVVVYLSYLAIKHKKKETATTHLCFRQVDRAPIRSLKCDGCDWRGLDAEVCKACRQEQTNGY